MGAERKPAARPPLRSIASAAAAVGLFLAAGTELTQMTIPGRSADVAHFAADAVGLAFGLLAGRILVPRLRPIALKNKAR